MEKQNSLRLFTGTYVDSELFRYVYDDIKDDFRDASFGKWVEPENLHFTYHFIGDVDINLLDDIKAALSSITVEYSSLLTLRGINVFPNFRRPRILHVPVYDKGILKDIYVKIADALKSLSIETEIRYYSPHLTLQRIKDFDKDKFIQAIDKYKEFDFGTMPEFKVSLIQSTLTPKGPIYKILQ